MHFIVVFLALGAIPSVIAHATPSPPPSWHTPDQGSAILSNFSFDSGETLESLKIHYQTLGKLKVHPDGTTNAILILHGTTESSTQLLTASFADTLFNPGQLLDTRKYHIILPDSIGHGNSSKPSNTGLRATFPPYQYNDMIRAHHALLTQHLGIAHTRLILGVSMGGMHTWMMGEAYPDFSDALMPIASTPVQISGYKRLWRKFVIKMITSDPAWHGGAYVEQPLVSLAGALSLVQTMLSGLVSFSMQYTTRDGTDKFAEALLLRVKDFDANDFVYAWNSSHFYDPEPGLGLITAPLTAFNTADDLMNVAELGTLERAVEVQMRKGLGKAVVVPTSNETFGHGSYIKAKLWEHELRLLLAKTDTHH
jgi:homoserine O-acetyltransferase